MDGYGGGGPASVFNDTKVTPREMLAVSSRQGPKKAFPRENNGSASRGYKNSTSAGRLILKGSRGSYQTCQGGRPSSRCHGARGEGHLRAPTIIQSRPSERHQQTHCTFFSFYFIVSLVYSVNTKLHLDGFYLVFLKHFCAYCN